jgi:hypothetical protein
MLDHDKLIDVLSARAGPVKRVAPGWVRAAFLIPLMLVLGYVATTSLHQAAGGWSVPTNGTGIANAVLCLLLGAAGLIQAFTMSIPGGAIRGKGRMMAAVAAWLAVAATSIGASSASSVVQGERPFCFAFLLVAGLPMIAVAILALRHTRSLEPIQSLVTAGGSVAFLSFGLLAFCHPVEVSIGDFATHLMAALVLGLLTVAAGRRSVAV